MTLKKKRKILFFLQLLKIKCVHAEAVPVYTIPLIFQYTTCLCDFQVCFSTITQKWRVCVLKTLFSPLKFKPQPLRDCRGRIAFFTQASSLLISLVKVKIRGWWRFGGCSFRRLCCCLPSCSISHILPLIHFLSLPSSLSRTLIVTVSWRNDNKGIGVNRLASIPSGWKRGEDKACCLLIPTPQRHHKALVIMSLAPPGAPR